MLVLLTMSMATPWAIMDQLQMWTPILHDHINKLSTDPDNFKDLQNKMSQLWQGYVEPEDEPEARSSHNLEGGEPVLPLTENVLTRNLGLHATVSTC